MSDPIGWLTATVGTPARYKLNRNLALLVGLAFTAVLIFNIEIAARIGMPRWVVHLLVLVIIGFLTSSVLCLLKASSEALKDVSDPD